MKKALVILFDKVEELEAIAPVDILRRACVDVTTAALGDSLEIIGEAEARLTPTNLSRRRARKISTR